MVADANFFRAVRHLTIIFIVFIAGTTVFSQSFQLKGVVRNEKSFKPIRDVNIKVYGKSEGTSTDKSGQFSLKLTRIPATLVITSIGYNDAFFDITKPTETVMEFLLGEKVYTLQQVDISTKKYSYLFKDRDYSVLDYELMGGNILMLVFRYQLKRSELVLLNTDGDTLAVSNLPELPPRLLFKDFLSNVHYFSREDHAFQCMFNESTGKIVFVYKTSVDSIRNLVKPFLFRMSDRLYFQENLENGFGTNIGYYKKEVGKKYIRQFINEKKIYEYTDDQKFYASWNNLIGADLGESEVSAASFGAGPKLGQMFSEFENRAHQLEFFNVTYPVVKTADDSIAFFNFTDNVIEMMDMEGKISFTVPITFHQEASAKNRLANAGILSDAGWRWGNKILVDEYNHFIYTIFLRNGMVKVRKIDLESGNLYAGTILPFPFPEKIELYKGVAYFLIKNDGFGDKWKLIKCKL